jgi:ADP-heptose:LPS heptosyltransferase
MPLDSDTTASIPKKILIIQTAFIGDVILATAIIEKLRTHFPEASIDFLLRKGNESLLQEHPHLNQILIWDKNKGKLKNLWGLLKQIRRSRYDWVVNLHRFASSGILTAFSGAKLKMGFDKNPFSAFFDFKVKHTFEGQHETTRNQSLISPWTNSDVSMPRLYPKAADYEKVSVYQNEVYICVAPTSVWFTKQWAEEKWVEFLNKVPSNLIVYLLGAPSDADTCERIRVEARNPRVINLSGKLSLLASAALMQKARMNFVNDSAPLHLASAMNAPTCAVYCSTIRDFGYFPLAQNSHIVEVKEKLECRPCGLHGYKACPKGHFDCAKKIEVNDLLKLIE